MMIIVIYRLLVYILTNTGIHTSESDVAMNWNICGRKKKREDEIFRVVKPTRRVIAYVNF